jgi:hypothetical protein
MKNSRLDGRRLVTGLMIAWLAAHALTACHRRTLTAGVLKAAPDAGAWDGADPDRGSPDAADARDPDIDSSPDVQAPSGPCGQATCLTVLFQTCVPEGDCTIQGGGSPSAVFWSSSYENGVQVSSVGSGTGAGSSRDWSVRRDQAPCYAVKGWQPFGASVMAYTITGSSGETIATGETTDKPGMVTVTCTGGEPILVNSTCLEPHWDTSSCTSGGSPGDTGGSGGAGETGGTGGTGGGNGGAGGGMSTGK